MYTRFANQWPYLFGVMLFGMLIALIGYAWLIGYPYRLVASLTHWLNHPSQSFKSKLLRPPPRE